VNVHIHAAFAGFTGGFLGGYLQTSLAHRFQRLLHVAVGAFQYFFGFQNAGTRALAQFLNLLHRHSHLRYRSFSLQKLRSLHKNGKTEPTRGWAARLPPKKHYTASFALPS
jgi:hypothetical protein